MSDSNSTLADLGQEVLSSYSTSLSFNYAQLSAAVLVLYDFFLTIPLESSSQIWAGKLNVTKALFFMNRYFGILFLYANIFLYFFKPATDRVWCLAFDYTQAILSIAVGFANNTIFLLRTFAIYGKSWTVFFLLLIPESAGIASNIWLTVVESSAALPRQFQVGPNTCYFNDSSTAFAGESGGLVNIASFAVFDVLVVILTVYRTARLAIQSKKAKAGRGLSYLLLRDGILYYMVIFLPTFALLVINSIAINDNNLLPISDTFAIILDALQITMVNRLVLNLSHTANSREDFSVRTMPLTGIESLDLIDEPALIFASNSESVLGNYIGGPVRTFYDDITSSEDEDLRAGDSYMHHDNRDQDLASELTRRTGGSVNNNNNDKPPPTIQVNTNGIRKISPITPAQAHECRDSDSELTIQEVHTTSY